MKQKPSYYFLQHKIKVHDIVHVDCGPCSCVVLSESPAVIHYKTHTGILDNRGHLVLLYRELFIDHAKRFLMKIGGPVVQSRLVKRSSVGECTTGESVGLQRNRGRSL